MTSSATSEGSIELALARSATYALLAQAFRYPDPDHWSRLTDRRRWAGWPDVLRRQLQPVGEALREVEERLFTNGAGQPLTVESAQADFGRLFGHAVKGPCPTYELEYGVGEIFQRVSMLADLQGFYAAFGLELQSSAKERADHVSVECEFLSVLAAKEAFARQERERDGLATVREATSRFLEAHLGRWLPALAHRMREADPEGFFGAVGNLASSFVHRECADHGLMAGPVMLQLRPSDEEEETVQQCAVGDAEGAGAAAAGDSPPRMP